MPPHCWKYVNWVISWPSSITCQPIPQAPRVGASQLSSSNLMSCLKVDADGGETAQVLIDHIRGRRFQDYLELLVLVKAIGIFAVAAVRRPAAGLHVGHAIGLGAEDAQERFRRHGARAEFEIVGFLDDAVTRCPVLFQFEDRVLEEKGLVAGHKDSRILGVCRLRSTCCSIRRLRRRRRSVAVSLVQVRGVRLWIGVSSISSEMARDSSRTRRSGRNPAKRTDHSPK